MSWNLRIAAYASPHVMRAQPNTAALLDVLAQLPALRAAVLALSQSILLAAPSLPATYVAVAYTRSSFCRPAVVQETLQGAVATQLLCPCDEVVSIFHRRLEHGYPTPSLGRDALLAQALPWLQQAGIWSRGRFGSYKVGVRAGLLCKGFGQLRSALMLCLLVQHAVQQAGIWSKGSRGSYMMPFGVAYVE
jgi:hypothetical protein